MVVLNSVGMEKIEQLQDKYKFKDTFEIEQHEVYDFCSDIMKAYYLGLHINEEDLEFIQMVLEKLCE